MVLRSTEEGRGAVAGQLSNHDGAAGQDDKHARAAGANRRKRAQKRRRLKPVKH